MRRATTPTHTFILPAEVLVENLEKALLTYSQSGKKILEKNLSELNINKSENELYYKLTQKDTNLFAPGKALVQLRVKNNKKAVLESQIIWLTVKPALNSEEL